MSLTIEDAKSKVILEQRGPQAGLKGDWVKDEQSGGEALPRKLIGLRATPAQYLKAGQQVTVLGKEKRGKDPALGGKGRPGGFRGG